MSQIIPLPALVVLLVNLIACPLFGQDGPIEFEHVSIEQGLSQSEVTCILQDREGFMWFGTQDGLNRYDGYTFTVYRHNPSDTSSIADNYITALFEDGEQRLWIGTQEGLCEFDRETERFRRFGTGPGSRAGAGGNSVSSICADSGNSLIIGTFGGGCLRFGTTRGIFSQLAADHTRPGFLRSDTVFTVYEDRKGIIWIGTQGDGLIGLTREGTVLSQYRHEPEDEKSLGQNTVQCILEDRDGNLWVGTNFGLDRLDRERGKFRHYALGSDPRSVYSNYIFRIYEDRSGLLWIGTDGGLELYDRTGDRFRHFESDPGDPGTLSDDALLSIYDAHGVVWFGTKRGLNKYCKFRKKFRTYRHIPNRPNSLSDNKVWSIYCDGEGTVWVGSNGGLDGIDRVTGRYRHYRHDASDPSTLSNNSVMAILEENPGILWLGTWGGGLERFDKETGTSKHFRRGIRDSLHSGNNTVVSLSADGKNRLWVATYGGTATFDLKAERFQSPADLPGGISAILRDPASMVFAGTNDRIWLGSYRGLFEIDCGTGNTTSFHHRPDDPASLSNDRVLSIQQSSGQNSSGDDLLIGTEGGLNLLNSTTGRCVRYTTSEGLPNDLICGILEDAGGKLWISTDKGIAMLDPWSRTIRSYDMADGLQGDEFNEWAYYKSRSGEMFFGGINGLTSFYPDSLRDNPQIPPVVLTSLKIAEQEVRAGKMISGTNALELPYGKNSFSFEFAALEYTKPEKNRYAYMLRGFDKDWIYSGTRRYAGYTNLDPGRYTLLLKGSNNDGVWNERGISLGLFIAPPFWITWWFRICAGLSMCSLAAAAYLSRMRSVRKRNELLEKRIEERTGELAQINRNLQGEVLERERTEDELRKLKRELEQQVQDRTAELSNTVSSLEQQVAARASAERNLLAYQEQLRSLASDLSMTEERERRRLSAYLHDSIGQTLAFCKIKLGSVQRSARLSGSDQRLREILDMIEQSIADTRRLTLELSPPILHELGLVPAIDWLCHRIEEQHGIRISIEGDPPLTHLDPDLSVLMFHAIREVIVNIVKHAEASHATVRIFRRDGDLCVDIEDNGRGFDPAVLKDRGKRPDGFGLFNIRERLHSLGGFLDLSSGPGRGTRVSLTVPLGSGAEQQTGVER